MSSDGVMLIIHQLKGTKMKRLTKNDFKKMVLMGIASGTMLASQANAATNGTNNSTEKNPAEGKPSNTKLANDCKAIASGCQGKSGCHGKDQAYRNAPQQQAQQGQQQQEPQVYTQWETADRSNQFNAYGNKPSNSCAGQQSAYRSQPQNGCGGQQQAERQMNGSATQGTNMNTKPVNGNNVIQPAQTPAPTQAPVKAPTLMQK